MLPRLILVLAFALAIALPGCTEDGTDPGCADLAGTWEISGNCGDDVCTISQSGCAITAVSCVSGAASTSGSIDGDDFSYTGTSGAGIPATCTGAADGDALTGSCNTAAGSCPFTGDRR